MIRKIISGGQRGADEGGLIAAKAAGIPTGGTAPRGWRTETGPAPWLAEYGLEEHSSSNYAPRTVENVRNSDCTMIFGRHSAGSDLTFNTCLEDHKPIFMVPLERNKNVRESMLHNAVNWLQEIYEENGLVVLNVAGNRESVSPGIGVYVEKFIGDLIGILNQGRLFVVPKKAETKEVEKQAEEKRDPVRYADLPLVSVLGKKEMKEATQLLQELRLQTYDESEDKPVNREKRIKEIKSRLKELQGDLEGLRFGDMAFRSQMMDGKESFDKAACMTLLIEAGVKATVVQKCFEGATKTGDPYSQGTFKFV